MELFKQMKKSPLYWKQYLLLESDLVKISRYVEFAMHNKGTYSIAFAHLILSVGSEIDVACKLLGSNYKVMYNYKKTQNSHLSFLQKAYSHISSMKVSISSVPDWLLEPWKIEKDDDVPGWWSAYNKIKHNRHEKDRDGHGYFQRANLSNALLSLAGLYLLLVHYYCEYINNHPAISPSQLFALEEEYVKGGSCLMKPLYIIPDKLKDS